MSKTVYILSFIGAVVLLAVLINSIFFKKSSVKSSKILNYNNIGPQLKSINIELNPKPIPYSQPLPLDNYQIFGVVDDLTIKQKIYALMNLFSPVYNFHSDEKFYPGTVDSCNNISIKNSSNNTFKNVTNTLNYLYLNEDDSNMQIVDDNILINSKVPDSSNYILTMSQDNQSYGLTNDQIKNTIQTKYSNIVGDLYNPYFETPCNTYYHRNCPGPSMWNNIMTNTEFAQSIININKTINWRPNPQVCTIIHKPIVRNNNVLLDKDNNPIFVTDFIYTSQYNGRNSSFDVNNTTVVVRFLTSDLKYDIYGNKPPMPCRFYLSSNTGGQWYSPKDKNLTFRQLNQKCINPIASNICNLTTTSNPVTVNLLGVRSDLGRNSVAKTHLNVYVSKDSHNLYPNINALNKLSNDSLGNAVCWQPPVVFLDRPQTIDSWNTITTLTDDYFSIYYSPKIDENLNITSLINFLTLFDSVSSNGYNENAVNQYNIKNKVLNINNYVLSPYFGFGIPYLYYTGKYSIENYSSLFTKNNYIFREASCLPTSNNDGKTFSNYCKYCAGSVYNSYPYVADILPKPFMDNNINYIKGEYSTIVCNSDIFQHNITNSNLQEVEELGYGLNDICITLVTDKYGNVYAGGLFTQAGKTPVNYIAKWNGESWSALGTGLNGQCNSLVIDTAGNLYAGGRFTKAGNVTVNNIAKWDGKNWFSLGTGLNTASVRTLINDTYGNLYVGGIFMQAGGKPANNIAKWDGSSWSSLGSGLDNACYSLAIDLLGNVYAGGDFTNAGGIIVNRISKWNGASWSALGTGLNGECKALAIDLLGNVYAGGDFTNAGGITVNRIAKWNGVYWSTVGSGLDNRCYSLEVDSFNNLYAGGTFTNNIKKWNGKLWSQLGSNTNKSLCYALSFDLFGNLYCASGVKYISRIPKLSYNLTWNPYLQVLNKGLNGDTRCLKVDSINNLYAGGLFSQASGTIVNRIAKWNGISWYALGTGLNGNCNSLEIDSSDNVYAGGSFTQAGGKTVNYIAKWDIITSNWSALGPISAPGLNGQCNSLVVDMVGNLYAGGNFTKAGGKNVKYIAKWDGSSWYGLGSGLIGICNSLTIDSKGNLYACGTFFGVYKWDGKTWSVLTGITASDIYNSLLCDQFDNIYVGGNFSTTINRIVFNKIAKWNGTSWSALGSGLNGPCYSLTSDSFGNIYAGGVFVDAGGIVTNSIAKWDGISWSAIGSGLKGTSCNSLTTDLFGNLYIGGLFNQAGGNSSNNIAKALLTYVSPNVCQQTTNRLTGTVKAITGYVEDDKAPSVFASRFRKTFKADPAEIDVVKTSIYPEFTIYKNSILNIANQKIIRDYYEKINIIVPQITPQRKYDTKFGIALTGKTYYSTIAMCALFKYIFTKERIYYFFMKYSHISTVYAGSWFWSIFSFVLSNRTDIDINNLLGNPQDTYTFSSNDFIGARFIENYSYISSLFEGRYSIDRYWGVILGKYLLDYYKLNDDIPISLNLFHDQDIKQYNTDIKSTLVYDKFNMLPFWVTNSTLKFDYAGYDYPPILINLTPLYSGIPTCYKVNNKSTSINQIGGILIDTFAFGNTPAPIIPLQLNQNPQNPLFATYDPSTFNPEFTRYTNDKYYNWLVSGSNYLNRSVYITCLRDVIAMSSIKDYNSSSISSGIMGIATAALTYSGIGGSSLGLGAISSIYSGSFYILNSLKYSNLLWGTLPPQPAFARDDCTSYCYAKNGIFPESCISTAGEGIFSTILTGLQNSEFCTQPGTMTPLVKTNKYETQLSYIDTQNNNADPSGIISLVSRGIKNILFFVYPEKNVGAETDDYLQPLFDENSLYYIFNKDNYADILSTIRKNNIFTYNLETVENKYFNISSGTQIKLLIIYIQSTQNIGSSSGNNINFKYYGETFLTTPTNIMSIYNNVYSCLTATNAHTLLGQFLQPPSSSPI
jgi:hypothetical protein